MTIISRNRIASVHIITPCMFVRIKRNASPVNLLAAGTSDDLKDRRYIFQPI